MQECRFGSLCPVNLDGAGPLGRVRTLGVSIVAAERHAEV